MSLFNSFREGFGNARHSLLHNMIAAFVNNKLQRIGRLDNLQIDTGEKIVSFELCLKGEAAPIQVHRARYALSEENGKLWIEIHELEASREWINCAFEDFFKGRKFELPPAARMALT